MLVCFIDIWSILQPFGKIYGHLVHFVIICNIFSPFLVCCTKNNLATLEGSTIVAHASAQQNESAHNYPYLRIPTRGINYRSYSTFGITYPKWMFFLSWGSHLIRIWQTLSEAQTVIYSFSETTIENSWIMLWDNFLECLVFVFTCVIRMLQGLCKI
jgi:hypothetical protein